MSPVCSINTPLQRESGSPVLALVGESWFVDNGISTFLSIIVVTCRWSSLDIRWSRRLGRALGGEKIRVSLHRCFGQSGRCMGRFLCQASRYGGPPIFTAEWRLAGWWQDGWVKRISTRDCCHALLYWMTVAVFVLPRMLGQWLVGWLKATVVVVMVECKWGNDRLWCLPGSSVNGNLSCVPLECCCCAVW